MRFSPRVLTLVVVVALVIIVVILGRLDFPGQMLRALASLVPATPQPAYTPEEITQLREEIGALESENVLLKERIFSLCEELAIENIKEEAAYPILTTQIIYRDHTRFFDMVIINKGSSDGVKPEMPVVDSRGLVGRVVSTRGAISRVQLITSPDCAFGVKDQTTGNFGIVHGSESMQWLMGDDADESRETPPHVLVLEYLSPSAVINVRDSLVTSGLSGITPPGIRVGEVREIITREGEGLFDIRVEPYADFEHLNTVGVILYHSADIDDIVDLVGEDALIPGLPKP